MTRQINDLNEEISRWAFEVLIEENPKWRIAFTNPTAGPWKTIKAYDSKGDEGEVYRFPLEETRPDIILYSDELKAVLIIEAKDRLKKLVAGNQADKSVKVVERLSGILSQLGENKFWGERALYPTYLGLLWGSIDKPSTNKEIFDVFDTYYSLAKRERILNKDFIIGIESLYKGGEIKCYAHHKVYSAGQDCRCDSVEQSII